MGESPSNEVEICPLQEIFGRELFPFDKEAISLFGLPKFKVGDPLMIKLSQSPTGFSSQSFKVDYILWSDFFGEWTYRCPKYNFYQCESNLEKL